MTSGTQPLVSVVTPVYNGETHLGECIESVLKQSYRNWEYIVLNNSSTDSTLEIAQFYAKQDSRIKVFSNTELLPIMKNWNSALHKMSPESKYCKVVHADDSLFPRCLEQMVGLAEAYPSIALVSSYGLKGTSVVGAGLSHTKQFYSGSEISRLTLSGVVYPFSRPTSLLIRSDLIRNREHFYNESHLYADVEICYELLRNHDFGFVHQVLTFIREHEQSGTSLLYGQFNTLIYTNFALLKKFGPVFLEENEYQLLCRQRLKRYYTFLAHSVLHLRDRAFWRYHRECFQKLGFRLSIPRLVIACLIFIMGHFRTAASLFLKAVARKLSISANFKK